MPNSLKGKFITFEGIDGSGKSTQIKKIKEYYKKNKKVDILYTREPGGTQDAEMIRKILLGKKNKPSLEAKTEILLIIAARYEHYKKIILPNLNFGKTVICDRFIHSTLAYQCHDKSLINFFYLVSNEVLGNIEPDLTILLDIEPKTAVRRIKSRSEKNHFDRKNMDFFSKVRASYLLLEKNSDSIFKFDASVNENKLSKEIIDLIQTKNFINEF